MNNLINFLNVRRAILVIFIYSVSIFGAAGDVDNSFNGYLGKLGVGRAFQTLIQPDGKIIVTGNFTMVNGLPKYTIVRLNNDGTLDTTFNSPVNVTGGLPQIEAVGLQSNGKIIIGGYMGIKRLNSDGSFDTAFNSNPWLNAMAHVYDLKVTPDDKIVFSGVRASVGHVINRVNADGSPDGDATFSGIVYRLALAPDGKIVYSSGAFTAVRRLNQDFTLDNTFAPVTINNTVYKMIVQPDGKTLIKGLISQVNGTSSPNLIRVNTDGTVDVPFVNNASTANTSIYALELLPNGKILSGVTLRNPDGTPDNSFSATNNLVIFDVDVQSDGKVIVSGEQPSNSTVIQSLVARYNSNGSPDTSFQAAVGGFGYGDRVIVQPDNKILVSGNFNYSGGLVRRSPARLNADGTVDTTFNASSDYTLFDIFPNGKIMVASGVTVFRLNSDGSQDIAFPGSITNLNDIKTLPDGRVLIARANSLERYNSDGTLDSSFNVPANSTVHKIALQSDGKILIGGNFTQVNGTDRSKIARLNADGTLDPSFNSPANGINGAVLKIVITADGKFVINGTFSGISFNTREGLARLNADGSLDLGFVPPGSFNIDTIKVQSDGKVLLGGPNRCRRLNANGTADTSFICAPSVINSDTPRIRGIDLQSDGKIIVVGDFLRINGALAPGIARLRSVSTVLFDYDGDGRADVSVYRASENKWYILQSLDGQVVQRTFAISGDVPVPADFDGDGKTDVAIFRPSNSDWWSLNIINGQTINAHWGVAGSIPLPSDFDGDGKADYVVFLPSSNQWLRASSAGSGSSNRTFGLAGDKPVIGDFDGDGKSDVAIYRPSTGTWWYQSSINNAQIATQFGISSDIPAPADFDGDGKTDFAVYRPSTGVWYISNSSNGSSTILSFGLAEDKPVPADYDGDGKADIAVFRPSTGVWYLLRSTAGFAAIQFGASTDIPTPYGFIQ